MNDQQQLVAAIIKLLRLVKLHKLLNINIVQSVSYEQATLNISDHSAIQSKELQIKAS